MTTFREQLHLPSNFEATGVVFIACRVADRYRHRLPHYTELMGDFGMSKSTALRWVKAMREARGQA